jgi:hypothetical protein
MPRPPQQSYRSFPAVIVGGSGWWGAGGAALHWRHWPESEAQIACRMADALAFVEWSWREAKLRDGLTRHRALCSGRALRLLRWDALDCWAGKSARGRHIDSAALRPLAASVQNLGAAPVRFWHLGYEKVGSSSGTENQPSINSRVFFAHQLYLYVVGEA